MSERELGDVLRAELVASQAEAAQLKKELRKSRLELHMLKKSFRQRGREKMVSRIDAYTNWDRESAVKRALAHADKSKATDAGSSDIWNFAFGSNVNPAKVAERGLKPSAAVRGKLKGWQLVFNHRGGYGNIEATEKIANDKLDFSQLSTPSMQHPTVVHGVLLRLTRREFANLAWAEYAYDTVEVPVEVYPEDCGDGTSRGKPLMIVHALAFKTAPCAEAPTRETHPSRRYLRLIQEGAWASGIDEGYCRWLGMIPVAK